MKLIPIDIRKYVYKDYYVDICIGRDCYEAWLCRKGFGIKMFLFGVPSDTNSEDSFVSLVERNIDMYIRYYENVVEKR